MANILSFLFLLAIGYSEGYKILTVFSMPSQSHNILGKGLVRVLTEAGHEVTHVTVYPEENVNFRQINISQNLNVFKQSEMNIRKLLNKETEAHDMSKFTQMLSDMATSTYGSEELQALMNDVNEEFDLVILEWMFVDLGAGLADVFNCPFIWLSPAEPHWLVTRLIDEPLNPAYSVSLLSHNIAPLSFYQRVSELAILLGGTLYRNYKISPIEYEIYNKFFSGPVTKRGRTLTSYWDQKYQASLMLGISHPSLGQATRLPQNYKAVAGYFIDPVVKPLPEDLKKIIEGSKHGVIYFSMGSNLKSKDLPDVMKKQLLEMFGGLKYTVLWKFEETLPDLPKNVHILKWAPQPSILAHPNTKLFITHGGLLSTTEAVHYGVPIIGIPGFADQFVNVKRAVQKGFAKEVTLSYDLASDLKTAVDEVLTDSKYRERVKELSFIYHDRPVPPAQELVHWVEHVIKTGGAPHLASPALHVPLYQKLYLDLLLVIIVILYTLKVVFKIAFNKLCKTNKSVQSKKKKN